MKIGGVDPKTLPNIELLVIPRGETNLVFRAQGLPDMDEFDKLVPEPKAPGVMHKDKGWQLNFEDKDYKSSVSEYNRRRLAYIVVRSLKPSEIEWDSVKDEVPGTWALWEKDMKDSGMSQVECNLVLQLCMEANCLSDAKLRKARADFLAGLEAAATPAEA